MWINGSDEPRDYDSGSDSVKELKDIHFLFFDGRQERYIGNNVLVVNVQI